MSRVVRRPTLKVAIVPRRFTPTFALRDPFYRDAFDGTWSLMNRTNTPRARVAEEWGGHVDYVPGWFVHTFGRMVPAKTYFAERPDYFQLGKDGKRSQKNPCPTHPGVVRIGAEAVLEAVRAHPDAELISVSKNDIRGVCQCPRCLALNEREGTDAAGPLSLVNAVAAALEKESPDVVVTTLAYHDTVHPPKTMRPRANVAIRLCTDTCMWPHPYRPAVETESFREALEGWAAIHDKIHIWDYSVCFGDYMRPWPSFHAIASNLRSYAANNVTGVMIQGAYQSTGNERELMRSWVFAKLLWDPSREVWPLMQDFIRGYYAEAAAPIEAYNRVLYESGCANKDVLDAPDFLPKSRALFDQAEKLAKSEETLRRVQLARLPILSVELEQMRRDVVSAPSEEKRERTLARLDGFVKVAKREGIHKVAERLSLDAWTERLRKFASKPDAGELSRARIGDREVALYRLNAVWRFARDLNDVGQKEKWFAPALKDGTWTSYRTDLGIGWEKQGFPGDGLGWFRKSIRVPEGLTGKKLYLYFRAVDESAWVYIDGKLVHENTPKTTGLEPYKLWIAPFAIDVTSMMNIGGQHQLTVRVHDCGGMGGIYMPVFLVAGDHPLPTSDITNAVKLKNPHLP